MVLSYPITVGDYTLVLSPITLLVVFLVLIDLSTLLPFKMFNYRASTVRYHDKLSGALSLYFAFNSSNELWAVGMLLLAAHFFHKAPARETLVSVHLGGGSEVKAYSLSNKGG